MHHWEIQLPKGLPRQLSRHGIRKHIVENDLPDQFHDVELQLWRITSENLELYHAEADNVCTVPLNKCSFELNWHIRDEATDYDDYCCPNANNEFAVFAGDISKELEARGFNVLADEKYFLNGESVTIVPCKKEAIDQPARELNIQTFLFFSFYSSSPRVEMIRRVEDYQGTKVDYYDSVDLGYVDEDEWQGYNPSKGDPIENYISPELEERIEDSISYHIRKKANLGIYEQNNPRRPRVPVLSFSVDLLEIDEDNTVHAAGPVTLQSPAGTAEKYLRMSLKVNSNGLIADEPQLRATYVEITNPETGACKETAALANE